MPVRVRRIPGVACAYSAASSLPTKRWSLNPLPVGGFFEEQLARPAGSINGAGANEMWRRHGRKSSVRREGIMGHDHSIRQPMPRAAFPQKCITGDSSCRPKFSVFSARGERQVRRLVPARRFRPWTPRFPALGKLGQGPGYAWVAFMPGFAEVARYQSSIQPRRQPPPAARQRFQRDADLRRRHITAGCWSPRDIRPIRWQGIADVLSAGFRQNTKAKPGSRRQSAPVWLTEAHFVRARSRVAVDQTGAGAFLNFSAIAFCHRQRYPACRGTDTEHRRRHDSARVEPGATACCRLWHWRE